MRKLYVFAPARLRSTLPFVSLAFSLMFAACLMASAQTSGETPAQKALTAQEWREDLHVLATQMPLKHKNLFHTMTREEFQQAVGKLDADIPTLNEDQILARFLQLVGLVQDGHSGFEVAQGFSGAKDHIPVRFARYDDGIYVRAAAPEYADAVGGRVLQIGSVGWQEAMRRADSVVSHDPANKGEQLAWAAKTILTFPRLLHGLGLSGSSEGADFVIEKDGHERTFHMKASAPLGKWYSDAIPSGWVDARPPEKAPPSYLHENLPFWFQAMPEDHAIYFQFNIVMNDGAETLSQFSERLGKAIAQPDVQRLVIDLRNNTGGDNTLLRPLLVTLISSKLNHRGGIFAIIGPTTFSAAQNFVNRLENFADVIFIGQPTGANVNFYGDPTGIELPHSHLKAYMSTLWWQDMDPRDTRTATFPEIAVEPSFRKYLAGEDSALRFALKAAPPKSLSESLKEALPKGLDAVMAAYSSFVKDPAHKFSSGSEAQVNRLGYELLGAKRTADAIVIFESNVRMHADSWNAWDSLGEGYAAARDKENALRAYRKSVELNPKNTNGAAIIKAIEAAK